VVAPNTRLADCLGAAEQVARIKQLGLWNPRLQQGVEASELKQGGYQRVRGKVRQVTFSKAWWVNFESGFTAVIYPENQQYFEKVAVKAWAGKRLEVEGWVFKTKNRGGRYREQKQWRIKLSTPHGSSVL